MFSEGWRYLPASSLLCLDYKLFSCRKWNSLNKSGNLLHSLRNSLKMYDRKHSQGFRLKLGNENIRNQERHVALTYFLFFFSTSPQELLGPPVSILYSLSLFLQTALLSSLHTLPKEIWSWNLPDILVACSLMPLCPNYELPGGL